MGSATEHSDIPRIAPTASDRRREPRGEGKRRLPRGSMRLLDCGASEVVRFRRQHRDLHMLQVTRGAEFPLVTVRTRLPESAAASATINADLEIQFAGQTAQYKQVPFKVETQGGQTHITGTIPATLADFKIDPPSLLTMPVKNDIPVRVDMTWHPQ